MSSERSGAVAGNESSPEIVAALQDPALYGVEEVELRETHISWVFLAGDRAFKLKKPLRLPFVDYGTRERRRLMCEEELRLNRRLAPDIYLGVRGLVRAPAWALAPAGAPGALEHLVEMRRFDERRTLAELVERGDAPPLAPLAALLARFHSEVPAIALDDPVAAVRAALDENTATLRGLARGDRLLVVEGLDRFLRAYLAAHGARLRRRAEQGRIRDGHGDLRADHVLLEDGPLVVDCVEFAPDLRQVDTASDFAYLVMDLAARGAPGAARELLAGYRSAGGDAGDDGLLAFFVAYRALVAAKVALLRGGEQNDAAGRARIALARRFAWRARLPLTLVLFGVTASGKSWLAGHLAARTGAPVLSSDRVRKRLAGVSDSVRLGPEHYSDAARERVYRELGTLARRTVTTAGGVIVDATFQRRAHLDAFTAALGGAPAVLVECRASRATLRERARHRLDDPARASDATVEVLERQLAAREPLPVAATAVDTEQAPAAALDAVDAALDAFLRQAPARPHHLGALPPDP
jgi:aminoglycoside phosphotransferase family enzyme/predicted kinase